MRLAFITSSFPPYTSGVAVNAATICSGLAEKGHSVSVFIPDFSQDEIYKSALVSPKLEIIRLPSFKNPLNKSHRLFFPNHKSLITNLKSTNPDIIHLQTPDPYLFHQVRKYASEHKIPLVGAHQFPPSFLFNQFLKIHHQFRLNSWLFGQITKLYQQMDLVITPTHTMSELLKSYRLTTPIKVISCGVDIKKYTPSANDKAHPPVILYLGRISPEKHLEVLIKSTRYIKSDHQIWITGTGKTIASLRSQSPKNVRFLGYIEEDIKEEVYKLSSIFVMPSVAESQSIASLEAAACGLPLVLANAAALPELIDSKNPNGLLFNPQDSLDLGTKLDKLLSHPRILQKMSRNSRNLAKKHHITSIISEYETLYEELIKSTGKLVN